MVWGCGTYAQQPYQGPIPYNDPPWCTACNRAVDIYFNEWVRFNARVRDPPIHNQQRIQTNLFI